MSKISWYKNLQNGFNVYTLIHFPIGFPSFYLEVSLVYGSAINTIHVVLKCICILCMSVLYFGFMKCFNVMCMVVGF